MDRVCVSCCLLLFCFRKPAQHFFCVVAATECDNRIKPSRLKAEGGYPYGPQETISDGAKGPHPMILIEITPIAAPLLLSQRHCSTQPTSQALGLGTFSQVASTPSTALLLSDLRNAALVGRQMGDGCDDGCWQ